MSPCIQQQQQPNFIQWLMTLTQIKYIYAQNPVVQGNNKNALSTDKKTGLLYVTAKTKSLF